MGIPQNALPVPCTSPMVITCVIYSKRPMLSECRAAVCTRKKVMTIPKAVLRLSTNTSTGRPSATYATLSRPRNPRHLIPCGKGRRRASASPPAGTTAPPRPCASQRSFGIRRPGWPIRRAPCRHTCSVRPSRPRAREGCCPGCPRTDGTAGKAEREEAVWADRAVGLDRRDW